jgi:hypothetical protein
MNRILLIIACMIIGLYACKSRKTAPIAMKPAADSTAKVLTAQDLLGFTQKDWHYFSAKADVEYKDGDDKKSFNVSIRMIKDSLVWISAGLFGIEGARILVNPDSMVIIDKINHKYKVFTKDAIGASSSMPLSVTQIQNLILGQPVYALQFYDIRLNNTSGISIEFKQDEFTTTHHYSKQYYTIDTTYIQDADLKNHAMAYYQDYTAVNGHNFPLTSFMSTTAGVALYTINMKFQNVDFETAVTFPFNIPASYERTK